MENNKCVLVKINEYYDLLRKSEENKPDEIKISVSLDKNIFYDGIEISNFDINYSGNIDLSENIKNQIFNIVKIMNDKLDSKIRKITQIAKELAIEDIKNLPWHKRLFFNEKYIK